MWAQVVAAATCRIAAHLSTSTDDANSRVFPLMLLLLNEATLTDVVLERRSADLCAMPGCSSSSGPSSGDGPKHILVTLQHHHQAQQRERENALLADHDDYVGDADEPYEEREPANAAPVSLTNADFCSEGCAAEMMRRVLPVVRQSSTVWSRPGIVNTIGKLFPNLSPAALHTILASEDKNLSTKPGGQSIRERSIDAAASSTTSSGAATSHGDDVSPNSLLLIETTLGQLQSTGLVGRLNTATTATAVSCDRHHRGGSDVHGLGCCEEVLDFVTTNISAATRSYFRKGVPHHPAPRKDSITTAFDLLVSPLVQRLASDPRTTRGSPISGGIPYDFAVDPVRQSQRMQSFIEQLSIESTRLTHLLVHFDGSLIEDAVSSIRKQVAPTLVFPFQFSFKNRDSWMLLLIVVLMAFGAVRTDVSLEWQSMEPADVVDVLDALGADEAFVAELAFGLFYELSDS